MLLFYSSLLVPSEGMHGVCCKHLLWFVEKPKELFKYKCRMLLGTATGTNNPDKLDLLKSSSSKSRLEQRKFREMGSKNNLPIKWDMNDSIILKYFHPARKWHAQYYGGTSKTVVSKLKANLTFF